MADAVGGSLMRCSLVKTAWRRALASGVALTFIAGFVGTADAAYRYGQTQIVKKRDVPNKQPFGELPNRPMLLPGMAKAAGFTH